MNERIKVALEIARRYAEVDGAYHKAWVIDQMARALLGCTGSFVSEEYRRFVQAARAEGEWDTGIAP